MDRFSSRFMRTSLLTYGWSVRTYLLTRGAAARAVRAEMPHPSSRIEAEDGEGGDRSGCAKGEASHPAKRGVIFHRTAPVVPPARSDERMAGDWWMVKSSVASAPFAAAPFVPGWVDGLPGGMGTGMSRLCALGSMKPRFCEGMG